MLARSRTRVLATLALALLVTGCVSEQDKGADLSGATSGGSGSGGGSSGASALSGGLYLQIESAYDNTPSDKTTQATCTIPEGSASGTAIPCTVTMDEADLYYSRLTFTFGTSDASTCKIVNFKPYYYQASNLANYATPYNGAATSTTDCSVSPISADCFNGPAVFLVPSFPTKRFLFIETNSTLESSVEAPSGDEEDRTSNAYIANTMGAANRGTDQNDPATGTPGFLAGNFHDYTVECRDSLYELIYKITLTVNSTPGATLAYPDWDDVGL